MADFDPRIVVDSPDYSTIDMSYESIATMQMGIAYPLLHKEILPGDNWKASAQNIMRLAPLQSPIYDDVELHLRAFFTPNRILDPKWKEFITGGVGLYGQTQEEIQNLSFTVASLLSHQGDLDPITAEYITDSAGGGVGSLADFLNFHFAFYTAGGKPGPASGVGSTEAAQAWTSLYHADQLYQNFSDTYDLKPFLGYWKIYDDWYRNERIQSETISYFHNYISEGVTRVIDHVSTVDNTDDAYHFGTPQAWSPFSFFRVNYSKDRYTTALPEPNEGGSVSVPGTGSEYTELPVYMSKSVGSPDVGNNTGKVYNIGDSLGARVLDSVNSTSASLYTKLASAAAATIQQLKTAFKQFEFFMKDTYNGNRYVEFMDSHYDVKVPDATLDRAIYLGQQKIRVSFGEVFQTSEGDGSDGSGVLGDYAGRGVCSGDGFLFDEKFLEHGQLYVIGSIVPHAKYYQGVDRKFFKKNRFDYFFPEFQDIGDDELYVSEIYNGNNTNASGSLPKLISQTDTFGFNARWAHYKESLDEVHGDFLTSMDFYHFGRQLVNPQIGVTFSQVQSNNRPFAVTDKFSENYLAAFRWECKVARPVKLYETY